MPVARKSLTFETIAPDFNRTGKTRNKRVCIRANNRAPMPPT
jgi:hypothetical protein